MSEIREPFKINYIVQVYLGTVIKTYSVESYTGQGGSFKLFLKDDKYVWVPIAHTIIEEVQ